jgi:Phage-integrase repeat unit
MPTRFRQYRPFEKARAFVHGLKLKSGNEWKQFTKSGKLPNDIPAKPDNTYRNKGWKGWGDWLGTGNIAPFRREFRSFEKARSFARSLGLKLAAEWLVLSKERKLPKDIPSCPNETYADKGWNGWGDWLGTGAISSHSRKFLTFAKARAFARSLKLKSQTEWHALSKAGQLPNDIPASAERVYANKGWKGWGDWLGTGTIKPSLREYRSFEEARSFARSLGPKLTVEWRAFTKSGKLPKDIPADPRMVYADKGWKGMGDWLGTESRPFEKARSFARSLGLKSAAEWKTLTKSGKLPKDIPSSPHETYADKGWKGMGDWLGTGTIANRLREYRSFEKARSFARSLGLTSGPEWRTFTKSGKLPKDIPAAPQIVYADKGWKGVGDWLGTGKIANRLREYRSFEEARSFVRSLGLKLGAEWSAFTKSGKLPKDIPAAPQIVYADKGWKGTGDWLGKTKPPQTKQTKSSSSAQRRSASSFRRSPVDRGRSKK